MLYFWWSPTRLAVILRPQKAKVQPPIQQPTGLCNITKHKLGDSDQESSNLTSRSTHTKEQPIKIVHTIMKFYKVLFFWKCITLCDHNHFSVFSFIQPTYTVCSPILMILNLGTKSLWVAQIVYSNCKLHTTHILYTSMCHCHVQLPIR